VFQKPLKIVSGVVRQLQPGDFIDPQYTPAIVVDAKLVTLRVNGHTPPSAEGMVTVIPSVAYVDRPAVTSVQPGSGKLWILSGMSATIFANNKDASGCVFRLRCNPTGNASITSPQLGLIGVGASYGKNGSISGESVNLSTDQWAVMVSGTNSVGITSEGSGGNASFLLWGFEVVSI
jgi:hypothetical protein